MSVRLSPGMVVEQSDGRKFVVIASGRGQCYSSYVEYDNGERKLLTEVPYWQDQDGRFTNIISHKAKNKKWAKQVRETDPRVPAL